MADKNNGVWVTVSLERWVNQRNSGAVVLGRSIILSLMIFVGAMLTVFLLQRLDDLTSATDRETVPATLAERLPWLGVIFATAYAALYTRFASQWSYLAAVYNEIAELECQPDARKDKLACFKAAFAVDAYELHLSCKFFFAHPIARWLKEDDVKKAYVEWNGEADYQEYLKAVSHVVNEAYQPAAPKRATRPVPTSAPYQIIKKRYF